jgi:hypothetical protein
MKNRKINFIKLGIFLFGISILLWNCEKESNQIDQNIDGVNVNSIIVEEFRVNENNNNPVFKSILTKLNSNSRKHKLKNNLLNFNIDSSKVKKIIFNGKTTYTLFVESETTEENSFDNLIIEIDSLNKARAFIVKYLPKNKITHYKEHNSYDFEGTRVLTEIDFNSNFLLKNSSLKTEVNCWFEVWCYHEYAHFAGASCQNTELQIVCSVSSGGNSGSNSGDSSNGGDPDNGDSETGGGANNNDDDDDDAIITAPIIKLEVCEDGKIYNETTKKCECPKGMVEDSTGNCVDDCTDFEDVVGKVLNIEGGFVDDPTDPGGPTNKGISWPVWKKNANNILGLNPTLINLQNLTENQAKKIYKKLYWDSIYADDIIDGDLRYMLFDFHVNAGGNAIKVLQKTLNQLGSTLTVDGGIGSQTINEINVFDNQITLYNTFKSNRKSYYNNITQNSINKYITKHPNALEAEIKSKTFKKYINGWINRANHFLDKTSTNYLYVNC